MHKYICAFVPIKGRNIYFFIRAFVAKKSVPNKIADN
jgi:hypothetical protein